MYGRSTENTMTMVVKLTGPWLHLSRDGRCIPLLVFQFLLESKLINGFEQGPHPRYPEQVSGVPVQLTGTLLI
eukprot:SAG31_NODE_14531_length_801_cov_1.159544_1_plen_73_part_00